MLPRSQCRSLCAGIAALGRFAHLWAGRCSREAWGSHSPAPLRKDSRSGMGATGNGARSCHLAPRKRDNGSMQVSPFVRADLFLALGIGTVGGELLGGEILGPCGYRIEVDPVRNANNALTFRQKKAK